MKEKILKIIKENNEKRQKTYQSHLVNMLPYGKVRVSRTLKEMEEDDLIERERYGMTKIVRLKRQEVFEK